MDNYPYSVHHPSRALIDRQTLCEEKKDLVTYNSFLSKKDDTNNNRGKSTMIHYWAAKTLDIYVF